MSAVNAFPEPTPDTAAVKEAYAQQRYHGEDAWSVGEARLEFDRWLKKFENEQYGNGYAAAVRDVDVMGARAHAWDEAVAMCCEFLGVPNVNWPNKYRETEDGAS